MKEMSGTNLAMEHFSIHFNTDMTLPHMEDGNITRHNGGWLEIKKMFVNVESVNQCMGKRL